MIQISLSLLSGYHLPVFSVNAKEAIVARLTMNVSVG